ncbi:MAG TPA: RES domain-containing protein [Gammaproteobacteria bacterium]|nr:RES domain-containing protein [Gammaproteobacteria bacterium]
MASRRESDRRAYRIVSPRYPPFDGFGTYRWGSRWLSPGRWVVHAAETYALAVLENLVHWQTSTLPPTLVCVEVRIPDDVAQSRVERGDIPEWDRAGYAASRAVGNDWYDAGETAILWVPSLVSPYESNVLFNQRHEEVALIVVGEPQPAHVDPRLWSR